MMNDPLRTYFKEVVDSYIHAENLPKSLAGLIALNAIQPFIKRAWERFAIEFDKEMEKKRGEVYPCKDCPVVAGCLASAVLMIADEDQWLSCEDTADPQPLPLF